MLRCFSTKLSTEFVNYTQNSVDNFLYMHSYRLKTGSNTISEFDFGMDFDENCSYRDRRSLAKVNN